MKQLDLTKPVQTRDGRPVRILCTDARSKYPVVGLVSEHDGDAIRTWKTDGTYLMTRADGGDLINTPVKRRVTGWMNVYPTCVVGPFSEKHAADIGASAPRIACIHIDIEYTEGDGLDGAP